MAVGLPSGVAETLGEAAAVVGDAGSGASATPLMVPGSRGLPERNPGSNPRVGLERGNCSVNLFPGQVAGLERIFQVSMSTFKTFLSSHRVFPWPSTPVSPLNRWHRLLTSLSASLLAPVVQSSEGSRMSLLR